MANMSGSRNTFVVCLMTLGFLVPFAARFFIFYVHSFSIGSGWGNALQEHFVNALLAYHTRRASVYFFLSFREIQLKTSLPVSYSITTHGIVKAQFTQNSMETSSLPRSQ